MNDPQPDYLSKPVYEITDVAELQKRRDHDVTLLQAEARKCSDAKTAAESRIIELEAKVAALETELSQVREAEAETKIFAVLRLSRGASDVIAAFTERQHAPKFIDKIAKQGKGTYRVVESTLYNLPPSRTSTEDEKAQASAEDIPFPNAIHIAIDSEDFACMEAANDRARARQQTSAGENLSEDEKRILDERSQTFDEDLQSARPAKEVLEELREEFKP